MTAHYLQIFISYECNHKINAKAYETLVTEPKQYSSLLSVIEFCLPNS
jgi:hypothetical protein